MLRRLVYQLLRLYWRLLRPTVLGARALVIRDRSILLIRHTYIDGWYLPGGGVNAKESFQTAIVRELNEECGLRARDVKLFGLRDAENPQQRNRLLKGYYVAAVAA